MSRASEGARPISKCRKEMGPVRNTATPDRKVNRNMW